MVRSKTLGFSLALCTLLYGCVLPQPPIVVPPLPITRSANVSVVNAAGQAIAVRGALQADTVPDRVVTADGMGRLSFMLPGAIPVCEGGWLTVSADGYIEQHIRIILPKSDDEYQWGDGCEGQAPADAVIRLEPAQAAVVRLSLAGRAGLIRPDGSAVPATSVTGFRLVELVARGRAADAGAFLEATKAARFARVLLMAANLFRLTPDEGLAALPATLDLFAAHGRYAKVTIFADTRSFPGIDYRRIASAVGDICATHPAFGAGDVGNELYQLHVTQADALGDVKFLEELRAIVNSRCGREVMSLGSTHAEDDESDIFRNGDFLDIHGSRVGGDEAVGLDWRSLRHTNEQRALADRLNKWAWNDEPDRSKLRCDWQLGMGVLTRLFSLGDTFHFGSGLQAAMPSPEEQAALACRARGWALIPDDWVGVYSNASFAGGPVKSATGAVRVYSSLRGNVGYTLVLGASSTSMVPDWADGWSQHTQILNNQGVQVWQVAR